jgi:hypothetical protein
MKPGIKKLALIEIKSNEPISLGAILLEISNTEN